MRLLLSNWNLDLIEGSSGIHLNVDREENTGDILLFQFYESHSSIVKDSDFKLVAD